jgi:hypothetical protein
MGSEQCCQVYFPHSAHDQPNARLPFMEMGNNVGVEVFGGVGKGFQENGHKEAKNDAIIGLTVQERHSNAAFFPKLYLLGCENFFPLI